MKKIISIFCFLMTVFMMASAVVSCGNDNPPPPVTDTGTETTKEEDYGDALPDGIDLDKYEYRVLTHENGNVSHESWNAYIEIEGYNGEVLSDAAFDRNCEVEDRLNCVITCVELPGYFMETATLFGNRLLSGDDICDIAIMQNSGVSTGTLVINGLLGDVRELLYVDLSRPYYQQSANEVFTFNGKQYFFSGDMVCTLYSQSYIWGNLDEWEARNLANPFQLVRDGDWTLETCFDLVKDTYSNMNGNSDRDAEDFYGITGQAATLGYCFYGANGEFFELTETGFDMPIASERNTTIMSRLIEKLDSADCYWRTDGYKTIFFEGRCLLFFSGNTITSLRDAEFETMVLPFPKYDKEQESYRSILRGAMVCVPVTTINMRAVGAITEAMFSASSRHVRPAFFERFVDLRVLKNTDSVEMLSLIMDSGDYSFIDYFDPSGLCNGMGMITNVLQNRTSLSSAWAGIRGAVENGYKEFFAKLP